MGGSPYIGPMYAHVMGPSMQGVVDVHVENRDKPRYRIGTRAIYLSLRLAPAPLA